MDMSILVAIACVVCAAVAWLNEQFFSVQSTIALMAGALIFVLCCLLLRHFGFTAVQQGLDAWAGQFQFDNFLLNGLLSVLLFSGALFVDHETIRAHRWTVLLLSVVSTLCSAWIVAWVTLTLSAWIGHPIAWAGCALFGALISPTDPIAVIATLRSIRVPQSVQTCLAGESLFNDCVGIVLYTSLLISLHTPEGVGVSEGVMQFMRLSGGGVVCGWVIGRGLRVMLQQCRCAHTAILWTVAAVLGGYQLAMLLGVSGPLAMVVAGLCSGVSHSGWGRLRIRRDCRAFWQVVEELANTALFWTMGLECLVIPWTASALLLTALLFPLLVLIRWVSVALPLQLFRWRPTLGQHSRILLTWGGLRGGLAIALALRLPDMEYRDSILVVTYGLVVCSIMGQGLSIPWVIRRYCPALYDKAK